MADPRETVSDQTGRFELGSGDEWLPPEIAEALRTPVFNRLINRDRAQTRGERGASTDGAGSRRFVPEPALPRGTPQNPYAVRTQQPATCEPESPSPAEEPEFLRRISEAEVEVAKAAAAVDRSASNVRTIVERNGGSDQGRG